jgi:hypothetical protein
MPRATVVAKHSGSVREAYLRGSVELALWLGIGT